MRGLLDSLGVPYVIENVMGAADEMRRDALVVSGPMFGRRTIRSRLLESGGGLHLPLRFRQAPFVPRMRSRLAADPVDHSDQFSISTAAQSYPGQGMRPADCRGHGGMFTSCAALFQPQAGRTPVSLAHPTPSRVLARVLWWSPGEGPRRTQPPLCPRSSESEEYTRKKHLIMKICS